MVDNKVAVKTVLCHILGSVSRKAATHRAGARRRTMQRRRWWSPRVRRSSPPVSVRVKVRMAGWRVVAAAGAGGDG